MEKSVEKSVENVAEFGRERFSSCVIRKGKIQLLRKWVRSDRISIESAAEEIGMTVDAFRKEAKL